MTDQDAELAELFRQEATERVDAMDAALLAAEADGAGPETIGELFRHAHTVKGAAGLLGLDDIGAIAHAAEDVLGMARDRGMLPAAAVPVLLQATSAIRSLVTGEPAPAGQVIDELAATRTRLSGGQVPSAPGQTGTDDTPGPADPEPEPVALGTPLGAAAGSDATVRVSARKVDRLLDLVGELALQHRRIAHASGEGAGKHDELGNRLTSEEQLLGELTESALRMRTVPVSSITGSLPRKLRDLARSAGKEVELIITGAETEIDRVILDSLAEPLTHLLRNAVTHGIELPQDRRLAGKPARGRVELHATPRGGYVQITVADDGRGVAPAAARQAEREGSLTDVLTRPGYSTAGEVTDLAGRGVGLDAVYSYVRSVGGSLEMRSEPGQGMTAVLTLPLALAQIDALMLRRGPDIFGIPLAAVDEVLTVGQTSTLQGQASVLVRDRPVPVADLAAALGLSAPPLPADPPGVIVTANGRTGAVLCDALLGSEEMMVKPLGPLLHADGCLGATILGDGAVALLLDPGALTSQREARPVPPPAPPDRPSTILVVEDSFTVRELQRSIFEAAGYPVLTAADGQQALEILRQQPRIALVVSDLEMPRLDGIGLVRAIRADQARSSLPVVIITAQGSEQARQDAIAAGATAFSVKSEFNQRELLATVRELVGP